MYPATTPTTAPMSASAPAVVAEIQDAENGGYIEDFGGCRDAVARLAAAAGGGTIAALATWWSGPNNALAANAFEAGQFDIQGIVPVGYAVFAMALGIAAGTVTRRTLPAIAISPPAATGRSRASRLGSTSCWPRR
jgi:hypothetical protein